MRAMVSSRARSVFQQPVGRPPVGSCQRLLGAAVASRQIEVSGRRRIDGCLAAVPRPCSPSFQRACVELRAASTSMAGYKGAS